ncbi:MAG: hypothetical protein DLM73_00685 [Chthoniobacterales bacterium]|nr:MAG: hypothetical protein DLM73_00685 [Chthoniobacterales bacterium]
MNIDSELLSRYKTRGILVDSSLLVVYLVGSYDRGQLINCRAIKSSFTNAEFDLLARIIAQFDTIITTPHVLTEVSNLAGRLPERLHVAFRKFFALVINRLGERNAAAIELAATPHFTKFGIADTAISLVAPGQYFVLTEEAALYSYLSAKGIDVMNFSHVRLAA